MGVLTGGATIATSKRELAYTEDPDVVAPPEFAKCGWVPAEKVTARATADTVTIRALTARERTRLRDVANREGEATACHQACMLGVERAGKRKKPAEIVEWVDTLAVTNEIALDLLGRIIISVTRGTDPALSEYPAARIALGYEAPAAPESEEVTDAGAPKSDG